MAHSETELKHVRDMFSGNDAQLNKRHRHGASARHIVEQQGGTIEVVSDADNGSTFTISLPLNALSS